MAASGGQGDRAGVSFFALPDDRQVPVRLGPTGQAEFGRRNVLAFPAAITAYLAREAPEYWYPRPDGATPGAPDWIINHCADPDTYAEGLAWLEARYGDACPIFNHPAGIRDTSRDRLARRLDGIPGLVVPKCVRMRFETEADLARVFRKNGFAFPVLVRPNELQAGKGMQRIDSHDQWSRLLYTKWFRQDHFMIQFEDSRTEDDAYIKVRMLFIGGQPFVRHAKAASDWLVHNSRREEIAGFPGREVPFLEELEADAGFMAVCHDIARRVGLDFFGADIGVDLARGRFVLFEANPAMNVFFPDHPDQSEAARARREKLQVRPANRLEELIRTPRLWACSARPNLPPSPAAPPGPTATDTGGTGGAPGAGFHR